MSNSKVSPTMDDQLPTECEFDIFEFAPTETHWLALLKCFAEDNVDDLKIFSKHVDWPRFLRSRDVNKVWLNCPKEFTRPGSFQDAKHPFPSNPFFVAMFYNAKKCLLFMNESGVDFSKLTENGLNAYHMLMGAIRFMTLGRCSSGPDPDFTELLTLFHHSLFTRDQQSFMLHGVCHRGLSPLSWGVFLGLANYVEYILYYFSPNCALKSTAVGITEHITMDVSEYVGENLTFFTSPICVLLDIYGESTLPELKSIGIFRNSLIWKQWVEALYSRNKVTSIFYTLLSILLTFGTALCTGSNVSDYLRNRCSDKPFEFPVKIVGMLVAWIVGSILVNGCALLAVFRKELYRKKVGYPSTPRQVYRDLLGWLLPCAVPLPTSSFLLWLYIDTDRSCSLFGDYAVTISGLCIIILLLASVCVIVCYLRLVPFLTTMMSSFYNSLGAFTVFVIFYLAITAIFARMFQASSVFSSSGGNSTSSRPDTVPEFLSSFYQAFLISLNVVDSNMFVAKNDRIDLNVTHIFYILFVPILFINFVIGLLSSVVTQVLEHEVENRYILMLQCAEFAERTFYPINCLVRKLFGSHAVKLSICQPLRPDSKLLAFSRTSLESIVAANTNIVNVVDPQNAITQQV